ncbi:type I-G CRISPR-associated helicase/endonuclease Cas3g [Prosthecodimorpha staleyi]|uniref:Type I-U CRISPR-associated helicase/endonuclease Cas3 n=1 Tax=Prosthecodimorpha staleyi TaxID=2840188 RepID=A0A947D752_9HYPH|nr:type I-U CRISPR-associated helicase/endonuclease Cas3 [Prosthecodimorpha staleyi]MBT9290786.1 type I-U CRISPR-associated helicase/endonuclease Cas3 [Prosthecodimorpha staleyi]
MIPALDPDDFPTFFEGLHGVRPFPWQTRLAAAVAASETGAWPRLLDLPTGSGKTATLDIAVFQLALEADRGTARRVPVRIAFVVDRRLVVDDAFGRARRIAETLRTAHGDTVLGRVSARLRALAVSAIPEAARAAFEPLPLIAARLRGGVPREDDWARTPVQPTIICTTVDQIGSRLLFRGYGVSDASKPIHAGLIGSDCRILLDEAHLAEPFRQTLRWVERYRGQDWREAEVCGPWGVSVLTATPGDTDDDVFRLDDDDRADPVLRARLQAPKLVRLVAPPKARTTLSDAAEEAEDADAPVDETEAATLVVILVAEALQARDRLQATGIRCPAIGIVVNRVRRARQVFESLGTAVSADPASGEPSADRLLLIGPARPVDRDGLAAALDPIRTDASRDALTRPLFVVATQCIEAGVDLDLDGLVTEAAPLDALRQRFGRLNRAGRPIVPSAAIVASKADVASRGTDIVYGTAIRETWSWLARIATPGAKGEPPTVDFGIEAFGALTTDAATAPPPGLSAPRADAPVLMPAHLDLLTQTWPVPAASPDIGLYLHGPDLQPAAVTLIWRADLADRDAADEVRRRLLAVPPRSAEAIELPIAVVRAWLEGRAGGSDPLADIPQPAIDETPRRRGAGRRIFRWAGDDDRSAWVGPDDLRAGMTLIAPADFGGVDLFGWNPTSPTPATDIADAAAAPYDGRRFAVRIAPGLIAPDDASDGETAPERRNREIEAVRLRAGREAELAGVLAEADERDKAGLVERLLALDGLPDRLAERLSRLRSGARGGWRAVDVHLDLYGKDDDERPRGVVLVATRGIVGAAGTGLEAVAANTTEDDVAGSIAPRDLALARHSADVAQFAETFARAAGLGANRVIDLCAAGLMHDLGKADPRFQAQLRRTDARFAALFGSAEDLLAKSARPLPRSGRLPARRPPDALPPNWRHEALSVRLAPGDPAFADVADADLVLWLIGTHHGRGRPFYPHQDPLDREDRRLVLPSGEAALPKAPGPQSLAYDRDGRDWAQLFDMLRARYGAWELARFEAVLRLADHRASEWAAYRDERQSGPHPSPILAEAGGRSP